jgi:hypothetical protein
LFKHTASTLLSEEFKDIDDAEIASEFRNRMTEGQTFNNRSPFRVKFYNAVIQIATKIFVEAQVPTRSPWLITG